MIDLAQAKDIGLIAANSDIGGIIAGSAEAPSVLRARGIADRLLALGLSLNDLGDVLSDPLVSDIRRVAPLDSGENTIINHEIVLDVAIAVYNQTRNALDRGLFPLILGGDHSISMGSVAAFSDKCREQGVRPGLVWVDTHADINTPETSPSHCAFGMPNAALLGLFQDPLGHITSHAPALLPEQLAFIGLRDVDPGERRIIRDHQIAAFTMKDIDLYGLGHVVEMALHHLKQSSDRIMVSFDLDVCDPPLVPGTGTPKRGGLSYRESHLLLELLFDYSRISAFELVELNPSLDIQNETADLALSLIESFFGKSII